MSKRATITVLPSAEHPDFLTVHDAMLQIADLFALLKGPPGSESDWRLVSASTNSPFTAVGEIFLPGGVVPGLLAAAELAAEESYQALSDVLAGDEPSGDLDTSVLKRVLARNLNGVGLTKIQMSGEAQPIEITPTTAVVGLEVAKMPALASAPRRVRGSLEGELIDAGHFRKQPALKLRERARGRIFWCRIPENLQSTFAEATTLTDVWKNSRVRLRGWIEYSNSGKISGMMAETINKIQPRGLTGSSIVDPAFTGGMDAATYLEQLRDGDLG